MIDSVSNLVRPLPIAPSEGSGIGSGIGPGAVSGSAGDPTRWLGRLPENGEPIVGAADPAARLDPDGTAARVLDRLGARGG